MIRFLCFPPQKRQISKDLKWLQTCCRSKSKLSIPYHQFVYSLRLVGENGPSEQWLDLLTAGISKENGENLERSHQKTLGKVRLDANGPKLSNFSFLHGDFQLPTRQIQCKACTRIFNRKQTLWLQPGSFLIFFQIHPHIFPTCFSYFSDFQ